MSLPVALQVYSVRENAKNDLKGTLEKIKEMGYAGVEFAGLYNYTPKEVKEMCESVGIVPVSAHVSVEEMINRPEVFDDYKYIGCKYIVIPYLLPEQRPEGGDFRAFIEQKAKVAAKLSKEHGIQLLYHNHDFEFATLDGEYGLDILYKEIPADELKTELDTCWVNIGGEDPSEYILKYSGRAPVVHLKDFFGEKSDDMYELVGIERKAPKRPSNFDFRPVGYGTQDWKKIIGAAEKAGTEWLVVEQDNPSMGLTPMECAEKSREYLKSIGY